MWTERNGKKYYQIPGCGTDQMVFMAHNCDQCVSYNICHACSGVCAGELSEKQYNYIGRNDDDWCANNTYCRHLKTEREPRKPYHCRGTLELFPKLKI